MNNADTIIGNLKLPDIIEWVRENPYKEFIVENSNDCPVAKYLEEKCELEGVEVTGKVIEIVDLEDSFETLETFCTPDEVANFIKRFDEFFQQTEEVVTKVRGKDIIKNLDKLV